MYGKQPLLQFPRHPQDAVSPARLRLGLKDRLNLAKRVGAVSAVTAKLAKSGLKTPWTIGTQAAKVSALASRTVASKLTGGASEIASGVKNLGKKFKIW